MRRESLMKVKLESTDHAKIRVPPPQEMTNHQTMARIDLHDIQDNPLAVAKAAAGESRSILSEPRAV
jgi:hypothetical protein